MGARVYHRGSGRVNTPTARNSRNAKESRDMTGWKGDVGYHGSNARLSGTPWARVAMHKNGDISLWTGSGASDAAHYIEKYKNRRGPCRKATNMACVMKMGTSPALRDRAQPTAEALAGILPYNLRIMDHRVGFSARVGRAYLLGIVG